MPDKIFIDTNLLVMLMLNKIKKNMIKFLIFFYLLEKIIVL